MHRPTTVLSRLLALVIVSTIAGGCATARPAALTAVQKSTITTEVDAFLTTYAAAYKSRDPAAIRALYVTDDRFGIYEDGLLRYPTIDAVLEALAAFPPGMTMTTTYSSKRITPITPHLATAATDYETTMSMGSGDPFTFAGVMTMLVEHTDAGWKVITAHGSSMRERGGS